MVSLVLTSILVVTSFCSILVSRETPCTSRFRSTNPSKSFQNVCDAKRVFQHYEKLKVENSLDLKEAIESFEVMYKKGLSAKTSSDSPSYRSSVMFLWVTRRYVRL